MLGLSGYLLFWAFVAIAVGAVVWWLIGLVWWVLAIVAFLGALAAFVWWPVDTSK